MFLGEGKRLEPSRPIVIQECLPQSMFKPVRMPILILEYKSVLVNPTQSNDRASEEGLEYSSPAKLLGKF